MRKSQGTPRELFFLTIDPVVRFLILTDIIWSGAIGLLGPIFALFIVGFIDGGSPAVAGIAAAVYLVTKSIFQIPAATIMDRIRGERDDFWILFIGSLIAAVIPILYLFISTPTELYAVQFIYGLVMATTFPSYMAIFTRHISKNKEGTVWGTYYTLTDLSAAATASIGGFLAERIGFDSLITGVVVTSFIGVLFMFPIRNHLYRKVSMP